MDYEDFLRLVKTRKSVRRFKSEPVPDEVLEKILEAALRSKGVLADAKADR